MENTPQNNDSNDKPKRNIILIISSLLVVVCALVVVVVIINLSKGSIIPTQASQTQAPATQTPVNTPIPSITPDVTTAPIITVPVTVEPTPSPEISATPVVEGDVVWINIEYLIIRKEPDFESARLGNIPYGKRVEGKIDGMWMNTSYGGIEGYIYIGKLKSSGRYCVVHKEGDLQPLS